MKRSFFYRFIVITLCYVIAALAIIFALLNEKNRGDIWLWVIVGVLFAAYLTTIITVEILWKKREKKEEIESIEDGSKNE